MVGEREVNVAVIGLGMGRTHVESYQALGNVNVVAVADTNEARANQVAEACHIGRVFTDYREMLKLEALDAVSVCTPNFLHVPVAVHAVKAGKHVLCEKPLSVNAQEGAKAVAAANGTGKILMMMFNNRYRGDTQLLKQCVDAGELGEIYFAKTGWVRRRGIPGLGGWFTTKAQSGGGPLIDLGVHVIDMTMWLMGSPEPVAVSGATYTKFGDKAARACGGQYDVEDLAAGFVRFANGASMLFEASWASNVKEERIYTELLGTEGGASLSPLTIFTEQHGVQVNVEPKSPQVDGHRAAVAHFIDCVRHGKQPISPAEDGVRMMRILDALYKSAETGREVRIP